MLIGINKNQEIKQINKITDMELTQIEIDRQDTLGSWSDDRILCYRFRQYDGGYELSPYKDLTQINLLEAE